MINSIRVRSKFFFIVIWLVAWIPGTSANTIDVIQDDINPVNLEIIGDAEHDKVKRGLEQQMKLVQVISGLYRRWDVKQVPTAGLSIVVNGQAVSLRLGKAEKGIFELASTSKAFTGLLIALLEREGVLNRQDLITRWLPELAEHPEMGYSAIRIHDLLFHTSGIAKTTLDLLQPDTSPDALTHLPSLLKNVPLAYPVATKEEYATLNYSLLGLVAERAAGKPFATLLREKIFLPLGMRNTTVESRVSAEKTEPLLIQGYKISFTVALPYDAPRYLQNTPAGYVQSTQQDMLIWLQFLLHQLPLREWVTSSLAELYAALELAQRPYAGSGKQGYAYGWDVETDQTTYWSHPGQNPNATAYIAFDPQVGVGLALLGNSNSPQVIELGQSIFEYLRGASAKVLPEQFPIDMNDRISTVMAAIFWLGGVLCLLMLFYKRKKKSKREIKGIGKPFFMVFIALNILLISMLMITPPLLLGWSWSNLLVWGPLSLPVAAAGLIFFANTINLFFFLTMKSSQ
ncbi:serine hydrolase domain-containing protein [Xenorhabdus budapestensis]|uniref:Putative penicillin binding protein n=1 Tax=Xenorhabdus budapestensis TaxID=290110 RepID=A0A2D0IZH5_XENBU|nr:serine hydrolase domain-containing protein [Xenorhabdus budapestensis]PHM27329.1 putative penicillin binding protein [Xenorhabdus budapestensis]